MGINCGGLCLVVTTCRVQGGDVCRCWINCTGPSFSYRLSATADRMCRCFSYGRDTASAGGAALGFPPTLITQLLLGGNFIITQSK